MNKNSLKAKLYLENNNLSRIQFNLPEETKQTFQIMAIKNGTNPSEVLRKFILKYNSLYLNKYEGK
jgi:hypothetical protein